MTPAEKFGRTLRHARRRQGLTQAALGASAGMHRTEIGLLEKGTRNPRLDTIVSLADALGVDPAELVLGLRL